MGPAVKNLNWKFSSAETLAFLFSFLLFPLNKDQHPMKTFKAHQHLLTGREGCKNRIHRIRPLMGLGYPNLPPPILEVCLLPPPHVLLKEHCLISFQCTGWSLKTVDCNFFLTDPKNSKSAKIQWFSESLHREVLVFWCFKTVRCVKICL